MEIDANRNVNYGDALCIWDYLFRTAYLPEERTDLKLGFEGVENFPTTFLRQQTYPLSKPLQNFGVGMGSDSEANLSRRRTVRRLTYAAGILVTTAIVMTSLSRGATLQDGARLWLRTGYQQQILSLVESGQHEAALIALQRASYLDLESTQMVRRMAVRNQRVGVESRPMNYLMEVSIQTADLHFLVADNVIESLNYKATSDRDDDVIERAVDEARMLTIIQANRARSHNLLGKALMLQADVEGRPELMLEAASSFEKTLSIEPRFPGAKMRLNDSRSSTPSRAS